MVESKDPEYFRLGNVQLTELMSATHFSDGSVDEIMQSLSDKGSAPYFIPSGASTHPLGGLGFARWVFELEVQEAQMDIFFDTIVVAVASGSTIAGMVAGCKLAAQIREAQGKPEQKRRIIGIDALAKPISETKDFVLRIARTTATKIGLPAEDIAEGTLS